MTALRLVCFLALGLGLALVEQPYQALSALGFALQQRFWALPGLVEGAAVHRGGGALLVFAGSFLTVWLAWGPLRRARGGGLPPLLALQQAPAAQQAALLDRLDLRTQLRRLPLMLFTHLGGLTVGIESPSASLGAALLLAIRRRWPAAQPLAGLSLPLVAAIGGGAGLGAAFRSPLLGTAYALEELSRQKGLDLVLPTLLLGGSGTLLLQAVLPQAAPGGQAFAALPIQWWGLALVITLIAAMAGALFVKVLIPLSGWLAAGLRRQRWWGAALIALALLLIALGSGGLSLNDGGLSLDAALAGGSGGVPTTVLWRTLSSWLSIAAGAPGGLMHDTMTLGSLLAERVIAWTGAWHGGMVTAERGQLAAVGATALFAAACGTPVFCALFVFTLQGDPQILPLLLLCSAVAVACAAPLRGTGWNEHGTEGLCRALT